MFLFIKYDPHLLNLNYWLFTTVLNILGCFIDNLIFIKYDFESPLAINELLCFLSSKILLALKFSSTVFTWEKFCCHSDHFVEKEKDENNLMKGLVNMRDGVVQTIFFFPVWFLLNLALPYQREAQRFFFPFDKCSTFSYIFILTFLNFFKWWLIVYWDVSKSSVSSQVFFHRLKSYKSF